MNEPKRRGRPPKATVEALKDAMRADVAAAVDESIADAQAYARRVWAGQTPDLPRNERLKRVAKALEGQGMSMEGVELP